MWCHSCVKPNVNYRMKNISSRQKNSRQTPFNPRSARGRRGGGIIFPLADFSDNFKITLDIDVELGAPYYASIWRLPENFSEICWQLLRKWRFNDVMSGHLFQKSTNVWSVVKHRIVTPIANENRQKAHNYILYKLAISDIKIFSFWPFV